MTHVIASDKGALVLSLFQDVSISAFIRAPAEDAASAMAMDEAPCRGRTKHRTLKNEHRLERNRLKGTAGNAINAVLAAAVMNFHKLLGAFWRIFPCRLLVIWNGLQCLQEPEARPTQYQYACTVVSGLFDVDLLESL